MTISLSNTGALAARLRRVLTFQTAPKCAPREISLVAGGVWSCDLRAGQTLVCREGVLWLTQTGDAADYMLRAGERYAAGRGGRVAVQGMGDGAFEVRDAEFERVR